MESLLIWRIPFGGDHGNLLAVYFVTSLAIIALLSVSSASAQEASGQEASAQDSPVAPSVEPASVEPAAAESDLDPTIGEARELYLTADFSNARSVLRATLDRDDMSPAELVEAHRYLATVELLLENPRAAAAHVAAAVSLDRNVALPEGASEATAALFAGAREATTGDARVELALERGEESLIASAQLVGPLVLTPELEVRCGERANRGNAPRITLTLEPDENISCRATALTQGGVTVFSAEESFAFVDDDPAPQVTTTQASPPKRAVWPTVLLVAGAVVLTAVATAVIVTRVNSDPMVGAPQVVMP